MIIGGGGSSSSNGGGLNDGCRRRCIGLLSPEFGLWRCAACGLVRPAEGVRAGRDVELRLEDVDEVEVLRLEEELLLLRMSSRVGMKEVGELRRRKAPGQPHS